MSEHDHHNHPETPESQDAGSQALSEALRSSFFVVKIAMAALVVVILLAGIFRVNPGEKAVILRFGRPIGEGNNMLLSPGRLYWSYPYPIDEVVRIPISEIQKVNSSVGWFLVTPEQELAGAEPPAGPSLDPAIDGYVITADRNIIHTRAAVSYHIDDPRTAIFNFTSGTNQQFNLGGISNAVQDAANNALVATAAKFNVDDILTRDVAGFQDAVSQRVNMLVEREHLGVAVDQCQVQSQAPRQLKEIFALVTTARQNRDKVYSEALGEQNRILSQAGAAASSITNAAESARVRYVTSIQSDAGAFTNLLVQYQRDPQLYMRMELANAMGYALTNAGEKKILPTSVDGKSVELRLMLNNEPLEGNSGNR